MWPRIHNFLFKSTPFLTSFPISIYLPLGLSNSWHGFPIRLTTCWTPLSTLQWRPALCHLSNPRTHSHKCLAYKLAQPDMRKSLLAAAYRVCASYYRFYNMPHALLLRLFYLSLTKINKFFVRNRILFHTFLFSFFHILESIQSRWDGR